MAKKPIKNLINSTIKNIQEKINSGVGQGINQNHLEEPMPTLETAPSETIVTGEQNSFLILGRDRPSIMSSGYGALGAFGASRIDLISGLASSWRNNDGEYGQPNKETLVNPSFSMDAARIYISQKSDIDSYLGLAEGPYDESKGRSTIGLKSDVIRIHARNDIKLVTGRGKFEGTGPDGERLSTGGVNEVPGTISFIAGNYTEDHSLLDFSLFDPLNKNSKSKVRKLQPIPKGDNLASLMSEILDKLKELNTRSARNAKSIYKLNMSMMRHVHVTPSGPSSNPINHFTVFPVINKSTMSEMKDKTIFLKDTEFMKINYLNPNFGGKYINSKFVYTT
jgi:hypothetical protein